MVEITFSPSPETSPSPEVSPSPSPSPTSEGIAGTIISGGLNTIGFLGGVTAVAKNPYGLLGLAILGLAIWKKVQTYIQDWKTKQAAQETAQGKQDFINNQTGQNPINTQKDNEGRNQLNDVP